MSKLLNISQMCSEFCCTNEELMKFVHQGMPHTGRGSNMKFNIRTCQAWYSGEFDEMQKCNEQKESEYIRIIGAVKKDIEDIIRAANSSDIDKPTIINMLRMAVNHSDLECSLLTEKYGKDVKAIC